MNQAITGFHRDEEKHWVADLACGHSQHVRHDPPWQNRDWMITERGRDEHLGVTLNCKKCEVPNRLVVFSRTASDPIDIRNALNSLELLGKPFNRNGAQHFLPGPELLRHIILVGCSPSLALTPDTAEGDNLCTINIPPATPISTHHYFISGPRTSAPACPHCKHALHDWHQHCTQWVLHPDISPQCSECNQAFDPRKLTWRRAAAIAQTHIEIWGIYPNEGIPSEQLLECLQHTNDAPWDFVYL